MCMAVSMIQLQKLYIRELATITATLNFKGKTFVQNHQPDDAGVTKEDWTVDKGQAFIFEDCPALHLAGSL